MLRLPKATVCKKTAKTKMCEVQVERLRKVKADTSSCVQEDCQKRREERMLPKHPCVRKLQEANAAKGGRMQEDCGNKDV